MNAEQWLADIEAKADAVLTVQDSTDHVIRAVKGIVFATAANPIAVKRLVDMLRVLACSRSNRDCHAGCPHKETPDLGVCDLCWIEHAYKLTEPTP